MPCHSKSRYWDWTCQSIHNHLSSTTIFAPRLDLQEYILDLPIMLWSPSYSWRPGRIGSRSYCVKIEEPRTQLTLRTLNTMNRWPKMYKMEKENGTISNLENPERPRGDLKRSLLLEKESPNPPLTFSFYSIKRRTLNLGPVAFL